MDFEKICTLFTMQEPYYGIILSSMDKVPVPGNICPTLGVGRSGNVFRLYYNNDFVKKLDIPTTLEVLKHEVCHLAFNHFSIWNGNPSDANEQKMRNIAADIEVNSYLNKNNIHGISIECAANYGWEERAGTLEYFKRLASLADKQNAKASLSVTKPCNGGKGGNEQSEQDQSTSSSGQSQQQKNNVQPQQNTQSNNSGNQNSQPSNFGGNSNSSFSDEFTNQFKEFDDHSFWPSDKESIETSSQIIEDMVIAAAEEVEKSCGTVPSEMKGRVDDIRNRKRPKPVADWKRYVRRYLGNEFSEFIKKSRKRESLRFPDAAGNRHRKKSNILVAIDTSVSISMPEYLEFFGQIRTLTATATFDVVECDADIQYTYTFRNNPNLDIHGGGGTSFQPVIDKFIAARKKYDALIYFTDGYCSVPSNTPKDTLWVISSKGVEDKKPFKVNGASVVQIPKKTN